MRSELVYGDFNVHAHVARELPDAGKGMCCIGSANGAPGFCTCWESVFDREQEPARSGEPTTRSTMCEDCAFRSDSPERCGDPKYKHSSEGDIEALLAPGRTFWCHQGMRRRIALKHPSGAIVAVGPGGYEPLIDGKTPYRADGTPGERCFGWASMKEKHGR